MGDWAFSLTHFLTIIGYCVTAAIAFFGFRTFERWKREKIEEKRIDIAVDALELAYESQTVFSNIRSPGTVASEYADMPRRENETDAEWGERGRFYAILKRMQNSNPFFERVAKLRPRYMALFGAQAAENFGLLAEARAQVAVAAQHLCEKPFLGRQAQQMRIRMECDVWEGKGRDHIEDFPDANRVDIRLGRFVDETERMCRPIIDAKLARKTKTHWWVRGLQKR